MTKVKRRCLSLTAILLMQVVAVGCRPSGPSLKLPPGAAVLRMSSPDDVPTLDPAAGYDTASWQFEQMIFDTLVRYSTSGVDLEPDLALSWEVASDARMLTFHLRHVKAGKVVKP